MEDSGAFYDALAPLFDVMTDWDARLATEGPFLRELLARAGARRVLDAACGSGGHAIALARWGFDMTGADGSPVMVKLAQDKARKAGVAVEFVVADMSNLKGAAGGPFDAVLCLGNSLPHLLDQDALVGALRGIAAVLRPGGLFITHNLNYDLRWVKQPRWFAAQGGELAGEEALVWRFADYLPEEMQIAFHVALFRKGSGGAWQVEVHTTPHRPLFAADLHRALDAAGFSDVVDHGRMSWPVEPFDPAASGDLVVVARRAE